MVVKQYCAIPFDLGGTPRQFPRSFSGRDTLVFQPITEVLMASILGDTWLEALSDHRPSGSQLFVNAFGFAVLLLQSKEWTGTFDDNLVGHILFERRRLHTEIIAGSHSLASSIVSFRKSVSARRWLVTPLRQRTLFWEFPPYVMSFYSIRLPDNYQHNSDAHKHRLLALLEPSLVGVGDTPFLDPTASPERIANIVAAVDHSIGPVLYIAV